MIAERACKKCSAVFPNTAEFFYRNKGNKHGLTTKCKACVNEDNAESHARRLKTNPEHVKALANSRSKKYYHNNLEKVRKRQCEAQARYRADPVKGERIKARKRAGGLGHTPEELNAIFEAQGCKCAICGSTDPGSKIGWNLDHCHVSNTARFILCAHCNRGLGGFRDNPEWLRKAAKLLDTFNQQQLISS